MQLGTRWGVGEPPPERLADEMVAAVRNVEAELAAIPELDTRSWRWTLTWLEGRPIAELDDGTVIRLDPATGQVVVVEATD
jgi:hypothetical protein